MFERTRWWARRILAYRPKVKLDIDLEESQWWPLERLRAYQDKHLRRLVRYAWRRVPAYRRKFDEAQVKPGQIRSARDLALLPLAQRAEMQDNADFVNSRRIFTTLYTGGSTGMPLRYYECAWSSAMRWAAHERGWLWNGYEYGKRLAVIAARQGAVLKENTLTLDGDLGPENLKETIQRLFDFKPQHLRGYVGSLYVLARGLLAGGKKLKGVESVNPISENLYDFQRAVMEEAFGAPVFEEYCCNDGGACAWECKAHTGLHLFLERSIVESLEGAIVTTELGNTAMPFIRYVNGDLIEFLDKECPCGRPLPLVRVKGRENDMIITPYKAVGATYLMYHGAEYDSADFRSGIHEVQYAQHPGYRLVASVVRNEWFSEEEAEAFERKLRQILPGMEIEIRYVEAIETTLAGKRRFIANHDEALLRQWKNGTVEFLK